MKERILFNVIFASVKKKSCWKILVTVLVHRQCIFFFPRPRILFITVEWHIIAIIELTGLSGLAS
jgi:hypothetical protein